MNLSFPFPGEIFYFEGGSIDLTLRKEELKKGVVCFTYKYSDLFIKTDCRLPFESK
jgi:hypothetical protein